MYCDEPTVGQMLFEASRRLVANYVRVCSNYLPTVEG